MEVADAIMPGVYITACTSFGTSSNSQWLHPEEINPFFLWFRDKSWERPYIQEHDPLFKFYILACFIILIAMGLILLLTESQ